MNRKYYLFLNRIPVLRSRIRQMKQQMLLYYPQDENTAEKMTVQTYVRILLACFVGGLYFIGTGAGSFYEACLAVCTLFMFCRFLIYQRLEKMDVKLLEELEAFLGQLRFQFSYYRRMDDALEEILDRQGRMMYLYGRLILKYMNEEEMEDVYKKRFPSRFLLLLSVLCKSIVLYGDGQVNGQSAGLSNLGILKESVQMELLKKKKIEHLFSGLLFISMIPLAFVKVIELWAISNMEELKVYYQGSYGMLTTLLLCLLTLICNRMVLHLQYESDPEASERTWLVRISSIRCIDRFLSWQINRNYIKSLKKHRILKECGVRENLKQFIVLQYVTALTAVVFLTAGLISFESVCRRQSRFETESAVQNIYQIPERQKEQVLSEIQQRQKERELWSVSWYMWLLPAAGGMAAYFARYHMLLLKRGYTGLRREEEILGLQTIILFFMHIECISGEELAKWLEASAFYFKDSVAKLLYYLNYQNYEAAERLREQEEYLPMSMILESVIACDRLPVEEAFMQTESDYRYEAQKYRQECVSYIEDKGAVCKVLAFIPLYLTIGLKLIVPFVLEGLSQLSMYSDSMKQFM